MFAPRPVSPPSRLRFRLRYRLRYRLLVPLVVLATAALTAPAAAAVPATARPGSDRSTVAVTSQHIAVPGYFPSWLSPTWSTAITQVTTGAPAVGQLVLNPASGPGDQADPVFTAAIAQADSAGVAAVGYVATGYLTQRTIGEIEADIDDWYRLYGAAGLDGIFFDEASNNCSVASGYQTLYSYVKSPHPAATVVTNQGTDTPDCYLGAADLLITFEGGYSAYQGHTPSSTGSYAWQVNPANSNRIEHLVYGTSGAALPDAIALSRSRNAGWIYFTPRGLVDNPWAAIPEGSYWWDQVDEAAAIPPRPCVSSWWAGTTGDVVTFGLSSTAGSGFQRVYVDADRSAATGFTGVPGLGADYLIEGGSLYRSSANGSGWNWGSAPIASTPAAVVGFGYRWTVPRAAFSGVPVTSAGARLAFQVQSGGTIATSPVYQQPGDPGGPVNDVAVGFDASTVTYRARFDAGFTTRHVYVDVDSSTGTGYGVNGIGADYLIENSTLYKYAGPNWTWTPVGAAVPAVAGDLYTWQLSRSPYNSSVQPYANPSFDPLAPGRERVVFGANNGGADTLSAVRTADIGGYALP